MYRILSRINLLFIFGFLNVWDFVVNHTFFNAMAIGTFMFAPAIILWFANGFRAIALLTLISLFEFSAMALFVVEGFQLGGAEITLKSLFWVPYLLMAGVNMIWGLKAYFKYKRERVKASQLLT